MTSGYEFIKLVHAHSTEHEILTAHYTKMLKKEYAFKLLHILTVFIKLINVKMPAKYQQLLHFIIMSLIS